MSESAPKPKAELAAAARAKAKAAREAEALRANLHRRKAQTRAHPECAQEQEPEQCP